MSDRTDLVTDSELAKMLMSLAHGQGDFSEAEGERLLQWAVETRTAAELLNGLIAGKFVVSVRSGQEPVFDVAPGPVRQMGTPREDDHA